MHAESESYVITNKDYLKRRSDFVSLLLEKGKQLKLSQRSLHNSIQIMDLAMNKMIGQKETQDVGLFVASTLLLGAKSGELDDRVPFIPKLLKYFKIQSTTKEVKDLEVKIAESLDWNLQKINFFTFVEYYLSAAVISSEDLVNKKFLNFLALNGIDDTVRMLVKEENSQARYNQIGEGIKGLEAADDNKILASRSDVFIMCKDITNSLKNDLIKTFEFYVKDLCNLVAEGK